MKKKKVAIELDDRTYREIKELQEKIGMFPISFFEMDANIIRERK